MSSVPDNTSCDLKFANRYSRGCLRETVKSGDLKINKIDYDIDTAMVVQGFRRYEDCMPVGVVVHCFI
jgi:hypothetical protein